MAIHIVEVRLDKLMGWEALRTGDLLSGELGLHIPSNQRPYEWAPKDIRRLVKDIFETRGRFMELDSAGRWSPLPTPTGNPHYLGTLVLLSDSLKWKGDKMKHGDVVDGQQRLTAITIVCAALRCELETIKHEAATLTDKNDSQALIDTLTGMIAPSTSPGETRVRLDSAYQTFFKEVVVSPRTEDDRQAAAILLGGTVDKKGAIVRRRLPRPHQRLLASLDEARLLLREDLGYPTAAKSGKTTHAPAPAALPVPDRINRADSVISTLRSATIVNRLVVTDEAFSYSVFSSLNARGAALTELDKIKNELYLRTSKAQHPGIQTQWDALAKAVPDGDVLTFLQMHHIAFHGRVRLSDLYSRLRDDRMRTPAEVVLTLDDWVNSAQQLSDLWGHTAPLNDAARDAMLGIRELNARFSWPALILAHAQFAKSGGNTASPEMKDFARVLQVTEALVLRLLTVEGSQEKLVMAIEELCDSLRAGSGIPSLTSKSPDAAFRDKFEKHQERRANVQRYILARLEQQYLSSKTPGGKSAHVLAKSAANWQVEHVLPQQLSKTRLSEWAFWRGKTDRDQYVNRLGNLLPLEQTLNGAVNNYSFAAKTTGSYPTGGRTYRKKPRQSYKDSTIGLVAYLLDQHYPDWTSAEIDAWQSKLADLAAVCWKI